MAGLIRINGQQQWSVAGWVFDHVLRVTRRHLPSEASAKIVELMDQAETGLNYMSLESLSAKEMKSFRQALAEAYQEVLDTGKQSFAEPEFYAGFLQRFEELLQMLPDD